MPANILNPLVAMMVLTFVVWVFMYVRRLGYMVRHGVDPQEVNTPQKMALRLPESAEAPSNNLKNLFELPVLFYVICLTLLHLGWVSPMDVTAAWLFVGLRAAHSLVHCTVNLVKVRFVFYLLSSLVLWFMLATLLRRVLALG
ncbi:MAG: MAPEG family protein [Aquabacterium sp.]|jgi:hypothetical protein|uniref:MAPEG family protein n=1 Tax=Aquabacterium sp. TaxID=1872578 RepID=UPI003BAF5D8E